jgi:CelD/BcsL family acetyltransferase involved in cellulose biosynthesis
MRVAISEDGSDFVRRDWTELVRADPSGTFFHSPAYLKLYWEEFGHDFDLLLAFAEDGERLAGACAFERAGHVLRFLGGTEVTDYMGPVAKGVDREAVAGTMIATLRSRDDWTSADLRNIPEDSPWLEALCEGAAAQGLQPLREEQDVCPYLELPPTWEEYLASLPSKLRHEIRRKSRRLEAERDGYRVVFSTRGNLGDDLDRFVALHRSSEGTKGRFMRPGMEIFFRRLGERFIEEGVFRLAFLEVGGEKIAGAIGFRYGRVFYLYNSGFDLAWRSLSPGMVLVGELIRACIEERLTGFDMLKGGLEYKYRFGSRPRRLFRLWMDSSP